MIIDLHNSKIITTNSHKDKNMTKPINKQIWNVLKSSKVIIINMDFFGKPIVSVFVYS